MKHIIIFSFLLIITSCNHQAPTNKTITVDPSKAELSVEQVFEQSHSVALETTTDNLISSIDKIEMLNNKLYILDKKSQVITVFDKDGFYLSKIDRRGQGPEEYIDIADFTVTDSLIYVLSRGGKKIIAYNHSDSFIQNYPLDAYYDFFIIDKNTLFLYSNYSNHTLYNVIVSNFNNNNIAASKKFLPFLRNQSFSFRRNPFNRSANGDLLISQQYDYNIYRLTKDTITVEYDINFITQDRIPENFEAIGFDRVYPELAHKSVVTRILHVNQHNNFLYLIYLFAYTTHITKIDITTLTASTLKLKFNDVFPFVFSHPIGFNKNYLIGYIDAADVLFFDKEFQSDKNKNNRLADDDNPVLFFHKLKD